MKYNHIHNNLDTSSPEEIITNFIYSKSSTCLLMVHQPFRNNDAKWSEEESNNLTQERFSLTKKDFRYMYQLAENIYMNYI